MNNKQFKVYEELADALYDKMENADTEIHITIKGNNISVTGHVNNVEIMMAIEALFELQAKKSGNSYELINSFQNFFHNSVYGLSEENDDD